MVTATVCNPLCLQPIDHALAAVEINSAFPLGRFEYLIITTKCAMKSVADILDLTDANQLFTWSGNDSPR